MSGVVPLSAGDGGERTRALIEQVFVVGEGAVLEDAADIGHGSVFSIDAFVVDPFEFPGGDIGKLAVFGTANDLAMRGAVPRHLTVSWVIPEGFDIAVLTRLATSMREAAESCGISIVGGDTKVLPASDLRGPIVTTAGVGQVEFHSSISNVAVGDILILTGPVGDHAAAILAAREGIVLDERPLSDCRPLWGTVERAFATGAHFARDVTRGGLRQVLHEVARSGAHDVEIDVGIPTQAFVSELCDLLGISALDLACEGTALIAVPRGFEQAVLAAVRKDPSSEDALVIGKIVAGAGRVRVRAGDEFVDLRSDGAGIPRIC